MRRTFSTRELRVLAASVNDAEQSAAVLAKTVKLREHTVRYIVSNLKRRGEIYARVPFLNLYTLGYCDFALFFSLAPMTLSRRRDALKALKQEPAITWMASLTGEFQYCMVITVKNPHEVPALLENLAQKHGVFMTESMLSLRRRFVSLGRRHLAAGVKTQMLCMVCVGTAPTLKDIDEKILRAMSRGSYESLREIAAQIKEPIATVSRRVRELEASGVIAGYVYRLNLADAGLSLYRLLLVVTGDLAQVRHKIKEYVEQEGRIIHYIECFGTWNYELSLEVRSAKEVAQMRDAVTELILNAGARQVSVRVVQLLESLKYEPFPL